VECTQSDGYLGHIENCCPEKWFCLCAPADPGPGLLTMGFLFGFVLEIIEIQGYNEKATIL